MTHREQRRKTFVWESGRDTVLFTFQRNAINIIKLDAAEYLIKTGSLRYQNVNVVCNLAGSKKEKSHVKHPEWIVPHSSAKYLLQIPMPQVFMIDSVSAAYNVTSCHKTIAGNCMWSVAKYFSHQTLTTITYILNKQKPVNIVVESRFIQLNHLDFIL